jgi:23S rRNA (pseudouridine1915-N3)-methyltransferase
MLGIKLICVGKLKEPHFIAACAEYEKRLSGFFRYELLELSERAAKSEILSAIPKSAFTAALCVEGEQINSESLAALLSEKAAGGVSRLCFIIGGSDGLEESVKAASELRLSMSEMTFPHHLARVMLLEQLYRAAMINSGGKYHK